MNDWNPEQYLQFKRERTKPAIDLVSRIHLVEPRAIIDIGCGPGNSTQILVQRWPSSEVLGLDNSAAMIKQAKEDFPKQKWLIGDAGKIDSRRKYDLVFSNAALQWLPDHDKLIPRLFKLVKNNGALAVQLPKFKRMPLNVAIETIANSPKWRAYTTGCAELFTFKDLDFYYDLLAKLTTNIELWETSYYHVLNSQKALLDFIRTTGLKPYLERLPSAEMREQLEEDVLSECRKCYGVQANGKVLFPFQRIFFIAYR